MEQYKQEFIEFMIDCQVLKFGDFVTKSGRKTPFFVNTGFYRTGSQLRKLGGYYAQAVKKTFGLDLMSFSDLLTRVFRCLSPRLSNFLKSMMRISVTAPTEKRSKIMATRAFCSAVPSMTATGLSLLKT